MYGFSLSPDGLRAEHEARREQLRRSYGRPRRRRLRGPTESAPQRSESATRPVRSARRPSSAATDSLATDSLATDSLATDSLATDSLATDSLATDSLATDSLATDRTQSDSLASLGC